MTLHAHDKMAEQALLGAVLTDADKAAAAFLSVPPVAWYTPKHAELAATLRDMLAHGRPVDPITVASELQDHGAVGRVGGLPYLHTLIATPYLNPMAAQYAARLVELYGRRRLVEACLRTAQRLDGDWDQDEASEALDAAIGHLRSECDELAAYAAASDVHEPTALSAFLEQRDTYDWLIPGLLERGDRLILTGEEGFGKSEFTAQIGLCAAGGVHPFTGDPLYGDVEHRVLVVDCENGPAQTRRRYRRIVAAVDGIRAMHGLGGADWRKRLFVEFRPSGLDLLNPADALSLENMVSATTPSLLVLSPLYKLHTTNINDGEAARKMLDVIDRLRARYGFALLTEAHAGHSTGPDGTRRMRPEGSSLFVRWPEFGFGIRRDKNDDTGRSAEIIAWRGEREARSWPESLVRGNEGLLPWRPGVEYYDANPGEVA